MDRDIPRKHVRKGEDRELLKNTEVLSKVKKKKKKHPVGFTLQN